MLTKNNVGQDIEEAFLNYKQLSALASTKMSFMKVFDIKINHAKRGNTSFCHLQTVIIAKVTLDNDKKATIKLTNNN